MSTIKWVLFDVGCEWIPGIDGALSTGEPGSHAIAPRCGIAECSGCHGDGASVAGRVGAWRPATAEEESLLATALAAGETFEGPAPTWWPR